MRLNKTYIYIQKYGKTAYIEKEKRLPEPRMFMFLMSSTKGLARHSLPTQHLYTKRSTRTLLLPYVRGCFFASPNIIHGLCQLNKTLQNRALTLKTQYKLRSYIRLGLDYYFGYTMWTKPTCGKRPKIKKIRRHGLELEGIREISR